VNQGERAGISEAYDGVTSVLHALSYPDYDRRLWSLTRSADPTHIKCGRSRAWKLSFFTAGGELHPAPRTISPQSIADNVRWGRQYRQVEGFRQSANAPETVC